MLRHLSFHLHWSPSDTEHIQAHDRRVQLCVVSVRMCLGETESESDRWYLVVVSPVRSCCHQTIRKCSSLRTIELTQLLPSAAPALTCEHRDRTQAEQRKLEKLPTSVPPSFSSTFAPWKIALSAYMKYANAE